MARLTQADKKIVLIFLRVLMNSITDEEFAELIGLKLRAYMNHKAKAKTLLEELLKEGSK